MHTLPVVAPYRHAPAKFLGGLPEECDDYAVEGGDEDAFKLSDLVDRYCRDAHGSWWPLSLSVGSGESEIGDPQIFTVVAERQGTA